MCNEILTFVGIGALILLGISTIVYIVCFVSKVNDLVGDIEWLKHQRDRDLTYSSSNFADIRDHLEKIVPISKKRKLGTK
jgi:hypothetical protein